MCYSTRPTDRPGEPRTGQTKRGEKAKPASIKDTALIENAGAVNTNPILNRLAIGVAALEIVQHRVGRPLDILIRVFLSKRDAVQSFDMLHVRRVTAQDPRIDRENRFKRLNPHGEFLLGIREVRQRKERHFAVKGPDQAIFFGCGKVEQTGAGRGRVANTRFDADAALIVLPVMKSATNGIALYIAHGEVSANVWAVSAQYLCPAILPAENNDPSVKKIHAPDLTLRHLA